MPATKRDYVNETRLVETREFSAVDPRGERTGDYVVRATSIISTDLVAIEVWEPLAGHSTQLTHDDHGKLGSVKSRPIAPDFAALPYGDERTLRCNAQWDAQDRLCENIIRAAFPEITFGPSDLGKGHALVYLDEFHGARS